MERRTLPALGLVIALSLSSASCRAGAPGGDDPPPDGGAGVAGPDTAAPPGDPVAAYLARVPADVFVREGACPFECCVYRTWKAEAPIPVLPQPRPGGTPVATVPAGADFEALGGHVRVVPRQIVILEDSLRAFASDVRDTLLSAGDTLVPLDHVGEGNVNAWTGGAVWQVPMVWAMTGPAGAGPGRVVGERRTSWWVSVRTSAGRTGWILADSARFGNADACG